MPITPDQDLTVVPANFVSRAYANLSGEDLFFYVTQATHELRVKSFTNSNVILLAVNISYVSVIQATGVVHLYFADVNGVVYYAPFTNSNFSAPLNPVHIPVPSVKTISTCYAPNASPPLYALLIDDGTVHTVYTSQTPDFAVFKGQLRVFNNNIDHVHYVTEPVITVHPQDTINAVVHVRRITGAASQTGFYTCVLPGAQ